MGSVCIVCETTVPQGHKVCSKRCSGALGGSAGKGRKRVRESKKQCEICTTMVSDRRRRFCSWACAGISRTRAAIDSGHADTSTLRRERLRVDGQRCAICHRTEWEGQPIPVVLDHIDGNSENGAWENTRLVCGNCDMQLPTYKFRNQGNGRHSRRQRYADGKSY